MLTDDFAFTGPVPQPLGKAAFLALCQAMHTALPDGSFNARDYREAGDQVTAATEITGTHTGPLAIIPGVPTVPATGKAVRLPPEQMDATLRNGKIARLDVTVPVAGGVPGLYAQVGAPLAAH